MNHLFEFQNLLKVIFLKKAIDPNMGQLTTNKVGSDLLLYCTYESFFWLTQVWGRSTPKACSMLPSTCMASIGHRKETDLPDWV